MTPMEWLNLQHGDLVKHESGLGEVYTVIQNTDYGVLVLDARLIENPDEWEIVLKNVKHKPK